MSLGSLSISLLCNRNRFPPPFFFLVAEGVDAKTAAPAKAEEPKKEEKKQAEAPKEEAKKEAEAPKEEAKKKESAALDSHSEIGE